MILENGIYKISVINIFEAITIGNINVTCIFLFLCLVLMVISKNEKKLKSEKRIPVLAWHGPPENESTPKNYKDLFDAGFTHNFSFIRSLTVMEKALDAAQAAGIKQFVVCSELASDPERIAKKFMDHPFVAGYHLKDEPNATDFAGLANWVKRIQSVDNKHWCYINLFPTYADKNALGTETYQDYVDRYINEVPTEAISFDHYPIHKNILRDDYYENLEVISKAARNAKKPFWGFTLAVAHGSYPKPKLEHLRLQVFSNLVYGAFGIQYFTYWTPPQDASFVFAHAPIELDGSKSEAYELAKIMNKEIEGISGVFVDSNVVSLGHTGDLPKGTKSFDIKDPIKNIKTSGKGAIVSLLAQKDRRFLAIVNRNYLETMFLSVAFDPNSNLALVNKEGSLTDLQGNELSQTLDKGDMIVLTWIIK